VRHYAAKDAVALSDPSKRLRPYRIVAPDRLPVGLRDRRIHPTNNLAGHNAYKGALRTCLPDGRAASCDQLPHDHVEE